MYATHKRTRLQSARQKQIGVTLIEILIAIVILGILSTIGVPSFVTMIKNNRLTAQASNLTGALNFARSEAIKRNDSVAVVSKGADGSWAEGWEVVFDHEGAGEETLRVFEPITGGNTLACDSGCTDITFTGAGTLPSGGGGQRLVLCDDRNEGREIEVRLTGGVKTGSENHGCGS